MQWFAAQGFDCTVITTYPYYPHWKIQPPYKNGWFKKEKIKPSTNSRAITVYRCPFYIPSKPTGKKRILQDFSYWTFMSWVAGFLVLARKKYDMIITVAPPFHLGYLGLLMRKNTRGKVLYHVQDMQIDAAQELNMISNQKLLKFLYDTEKKLMLKADYVSSISHGMIRKIKTKVDRDIIYFPNWVDVKAFYPMDSPRHLKTHWDYAADDVVFLYSGAIGEKQDLESILFVAKELRDIAAIKFIICGTGPYKDKLIATTRRENLSNVSFLPVQRKEDFNTFLNMADYHLVLQKGVVSDLGMPSKLATILAVGGVPIVTTSKDSSLYQAVYDNDLGYIVEPDKPELLSDLIRQVYSSGFSETKSRNARNYAVKHLNIDNILSALLGDIFEDAIQVKSEPQSSEPSRSF